MKKSPYKKILSVLCIVLYCALACLHSTTPLTEDSKSVITGNLAYSATAIDFSIHTFQPESTQTIIKTPRGASLSFFANSSFRNLTLQISALQIFNKSLTRYFHVSKNLIVRFSPVHIIFPFHAFW